MLRHPKLKVIRKRFKSQLKVGFARSQNLCFGSVGLLSKESGFISSKTLDMARQHIAKSAKRGAKIWFKCFPDHPITSKPSEVRMGKGKGNIVSWSAKIRKGLVFLEMAGADETLLERTLKTLQFKLPIKTKLIKL